MSASLRELDIEHLSIPQRLDLIAVLWDSIPESAETLPVLDLHWQELERRLAAADADPAAGAPWEQVKARLRG
jgi:putative addiction module component (TIGR02574 family)